MGLHAKLSASGAYRWMRCPGSINLIDRLPQDDGEGVPSIYALEGIEAHRILQETLDGIPQEVIPSGVKVALEYVASLRERYPDAIIQSEQTVHLDHIYPGLFGTADIILRCAKLRHLLIVDYKNGYHPVLLKDELGPNPQLMYYAAGVLGDSQDYDTVGIAIVQPNCPQVAPVREMNFKVAVLREWADITLRQAAVATEPADAPLHAGDHCRWCPAKVICPEIKRVALEKIRALYAEVEED